MSVRRGPVRTQETRRTTGFVLDWAVRIRGIAANLKLMLVMMAMESNSNGVCEVPVRWLADHCNTNVRHAQKLLLRLRDLGLITVIEMAPGTMDRTRYFALQITIDPDIWTPAHGEFVDASTSYATRNRTLVRCAITTTQFQQELLKVCLNDSRREMLYRTHLGVIHLLGIQAGRVVLRIPHKDCVEMVYGEFKQPLLDIASKLSKQTVKRIQLIHPQPRSSR